MTGGFVATNSGGGFDGNTKQDKVIPSAAGNIQTLDADGNTLDSGKIFDDAGSTSNDILTASKTIQLIGDASAGKRFIADWDANTNTPTLSSPPTAPTYKQGDYYDVTATGTQFALTFTVGDRLIAAFDLSTGALKWIVQDLGKLANQIAYDNTVSGLLATDVQAATDEVNTNIQDHIADENNPHSVTKGQVGLGNVANVDTTTTQNITDFTDKRFVTDAEQTVLSNTSGVNSGDETQNTIRAKLGVATTTTDGYVTSTDWNIFNDKEPSFAKNTAFNTNFGTGAGQTLEGNATFDASKIVSGVLDISRLPATAINTVVIVADETERFALTTVQVQNGDSVKQTDTDTLYRVIDDTNLSNASGYITYTAATDWSTIQNKPASILEIVAITKVDDDIIQVKGDVFTNRTVAQFKGDLLLDNVENVDTTILANTSINGTFTPSNATIVTGDNGKIGFEKTQGQLDAKLDVSKVQSFNNIQKQQAIQNVSSILSLTAAERDALTWNEGDLIFNKNAKAVQEYLSAAWVSYGGGEFTPIGTILAWAGSDVVIPAGYLLLNGQSVLKSQYEELAVVMPSFVSGANLILLDPRGYAFRGSGTNADGTVSGAFLAKQGFSTALPTIAFTTNTTGEHTHTVNGAALSGYDTGSIFNNKDGLNTEVGTYVTSEAGDHMHTIIDGGDAETRMKNIAVHYIIKAKNTAISQYQITGGNGITVTNDDNTKTSTISAIFPNENYIINGDFIVSQRGSTLTHTGGGREPTVDRWAVSRSDATGDYSTAQQNPTGQQPIIKVERTVDGAATDDIAIGQYVQSNTVANALAGKTITLSASIQHGTTYSSVAGVQMLVYSSTAVDDTFSFHTGFTTGNQLLSTFQSTISTSLVSVNTIVNIPTNARSLMVVFIQVAPQGTAGANDAFFLANIKLEIGSVATPFIYKDTTEVLKECQNYFERIDATTAGNPVTATFADGSATVRGMVNYGHKIKTPTITISTQTALNCLKNGTDTTSTSVTFTVINRRRARLDMSTAGAVAGGESILLTFVSGAAFIDINAENY